MDTRLDERLRAERLKPIVASLQEKLVAAQIAKKLIQYFRLTKLVSQNVMPRADLGDVIEVVFVFDSQDIAYMIGANKQQMTLHFRFQLSEIAQDNQFIVKLSQQFEAYVNFLLDRQNHPILR